MVIIMHDINGKNYIKWNELVSMQPAANKCIEVQKKK